MSAMNGSWRMCTAGLGSERIVIPLEFSVEPSGRLGRIATDLKAFV